MYFLSIPKRKCNVGQKNSIFKGVPGLITPCKNNPINIEQKGTKENKRELKLNLYKIRANKKKYLIPANYF